MIIVSRSAKQKKQGLMHDVTTRFMGQVTGAPDLEALILEQLYCILGPVL